MTIYRTWPDMPQLLGDLMTREWAGVVAAAVAADDPAPRPRHRLADASSARSARCATTSCSCGSSSSTPSCSCPTCSPGAAARRTLILALTRGRDRAPARRAGDGPRRATRSLIARGAGAGRPRLRALRRTRWSTTRSPRRTSTPSCASSSPGRWPHEQRPASPPGLAGAARPTSTWSSSASASPAPASPSTPSPAACRCSPSTPTTSPSAPRAGRPSWCTAGCATSPRARSASPTRAPSSAAS